MQELKKKNQRKLIKKASSPFFWFLRLVFTPALYLLFRFKFDRKTAKGIKRPCLVLANHQTVIDQFAVGCGFNFAINYVATDTIFRHGFLSWLMKVLARPIPFSKGSSDSSAIRNMMSVIKDGGCVGMFPSGNRSCFGNESPMVQGIGKLAKRFNVPLVLVQIRGGYNTIPRWKEKPSLGKMTAAVTRVVPPEELSVMSNEEIENIIKKELSFNEFEYNKTAKIEYRGKNKAEYLECMLFYCPECNSLSGLFSDGNDIFCRDCGARVRINATGFFDKINKAEKIPDSILEWSRKQLEYVKSIDFSAFIDKPVFSDPNVNLLKAERAKKELLINSGPIELYADKMIICGKEFLYDQISTTVVGARKMNIYANDGVYAVTVPYRTNLVKYMICSYHLKYKKSGVTEDFYGY